MAEAPALSPLRTALVIVGHGSARNPMSSRPTREHAESIASRRLFAEVRCAFWKEEPFLSGALDAVSASQAVIVPNLACKGYITGTVLPREMDLSGDVTFRDGRRIVLADPVGTHPGISDAVAARVRSVIRDSGLTPEEVCVLLVGHGTTRDSGSSLQTTAVAKSLDSLGLASEVKVAFLEQEPRVEDWRSVTAAPNLVVMPFMISNGLHGAVDVPEMLGLDPAAPAFTRMAENGVPAGPFSVGDRKIWYCRAVGNEPAVADIIVDLAEKALARA